MDELRPRGIVAFSIYLLYKQFTKCKDAYDKAKEGVETMRDARNKMDEIYDGVVEARDTMRQARDRLYEDLTSEVFLNDLRELKGTLDKLTQDGTDEEFQEILDKIDHYINNIKNKDPGFVDVANMISELYSAMGSVSSYIDCYTAKTGVVRKVIDDCREGDGTLHQINEGARVFFENNWETCQRKIGMSPFSDETLQKTIDEQSAKMNFSKVCDANDKFKELRACERSRAQEYFVSLEKANTHDQYKLCIHV
ncbi:hypothetical protein QZH41_000063 [Actinostola sp. cb2023]|nr:hypothetical protein QZH41_000063 [Actinostola sp. cb2023]